MRTLTSIEGNRQRLDGGAMFGNVPRALWSRWVQVDEHHRIILACRCLLVREGDRSILFETGIGAYMAPKLRERFGVEPDEHVLLDSLEAAGAPHDTIDIVVLSHLHFDHAGGLLAPWKPEESARLLFPNARYIVGRHAWERAVTPHPRDRASFIPELNQLLQDSGRLELAEIDDAERLLGKGFQFRISNGHTPGMLLTEVETTTGPVFFAADLIPGVPWVRLPVTMGYDRYPERLIDEKHTMLEDLMTRGGRVFYTHDPHVAVSALTRDDRGRPAAADTLASLNRWPG